MSHMMPDDLWREFPKTAGEFEARFATEEDCRAYWIKARWGGKPACARCDSQRVWTIRCGTTFNGPFTVGAGSTLRVLGDGNLGSVNLTVLKTVLKNKGKVQTLNYLKTWNELKENSDLVSAPA